MKKYRKKLETFVMSISASERKKRAFEKYKIERDRFMKMQSDSFEFEYIKLKSEYEHKRNKLSLLLLVLALSFLADIWSRMLIFFERCVSYFQRALDNFILIKVGSILLLIIVVFISIILLGSIVYYMKMINKLYKKIIMLEEIRSTRK